MMLQLGKELDLQAVKRSSDAELQIAPETPVPDLFDQCSSKLLILGGPGSGKTTTLLELADALIDRAERDENYHIPVVFNLSSWAVGQLTLEDWLVEELIARYRIPKRIARFWIRDRCAPTATR